MSDGGPLLWRHSILAEAYPRVLAGRTLTDCIASFDAAKQKAGTIIPKLWGGAVYQRTPGLQRAPLDLEAEEFTFRFQGAIEADYFPWRRLHAIAGRAPVQFFFADPIEDVWVIGATAQTTWTLSRSLPYGLVAYAAIEEPRAWIASDQDGATDTEQTIVTGAPGAGDVQVSDTTNATTITTPDISADAGKLLIFRYYPLRLFSILSLSRAIPEPNGLDFEVQLSEQVPSRSSY